MVAKRYGFLRALVVVFRVLAWVVGIGCALGFVGTLIAVAVTRSAEPAIFSVILPIYSVLGFVYFYAAAEFILVVLDAEENTRRTADYLAYLAQTGASLPQPPAV